MLQFCSRDDTFPHRQPFFDSQRSPGYLVCNDILCHFRNLLLSTIYRLICYTCNLVLKFTRILWMLYTDTFIGNSFFLFLGAIDIDTIYFIINWHFVWIEPYSWKYLHILSFDQINFFLRKHGYLHFIPLTYSYLICADCMPKGGGWFIYPQVVGIALVYKGDGLGSIPFNSKALPSWLPPAMTRGSKTVLTGDSNRKPSEFHCGAT